MKKMKLKQYCNNRGTILQVVLVIFIVLMLISPLQQEPFPERS